MFDLKTFPKTLKAAQHTVFNHRHAVRSCLEVLPALFTTPADQAPWFVILLDFEIINARRGRTRPRLHYEYIFEPCPAG